MFNPFNLHTLTTLSFNLVNHSTYPVQHQFSSFPYFSHFSLIIRLLKPIFLKHTQKFLQHERMRWSYNIFLPRQIVQTNEETHKVSLKLISEKTRSSVKKRNYELDIRIYWGDVHKCPSTLEGGGTKGKRDVTRERRWSKIRTWRHLWTASDRIFTNEDKFFENNWNYLGNCI